MAVLAVGVGAFLLVRQRVPHRELRSALQRARHAKQVQWMIRAIKSREDFVAAFDEFVIYSGGLQSRSWNTQTVHATLVESHPEYSKQIGELVDQYNLARYAPDNLQPSEAEKLEHNASTLHQLATRNATAPSESAAVRGV